MRVLVTMWRMVSVLASKSMASPPQPHHLGAAQSVKGCKLDDKFQLMPLGGFKELFHLLGAVIACHKRLRLRAVNLVHRVAGNQVNPHGVFQRLVKIGVESQDRGVFQRFRFVQIKNFGFAAAAALPALRPAVQSRE